MKVLYVHPVRIFDTFCKFTFDHDVAESFLFGHLIPKKLTYQFEVGFRKVAGQLTEIWKSGLN